MNHIKLNISLDYNKVDIKLHEFESEKQLTNYLFKERINELNDKKGVLLLAFDNEILITENISIIFDSLECFNDNVVYLFKYKTYQDAYLNALLMREDNKKCYNN